MYSFKEKVSSPSCFRSPYSRVNSRNSVPSVGRFVNNPRTSENNFGRSHLTAKPFFPKTPHANYALVIPNLNETTLIYGEPYKYDHQNENPGAFASGCDNRNESVGRFRPRKSQLDERRNSGQLINTVNLELMSLRNTNDNSETSKKNTSKFTTNTQESVAKSEVKIKNRDNSFRILTGSVGNILHWSKLKNSLQILFEVTATLEEVQTGKWEGEKILYLRDYKTGPNLQVSYHEIDRPLPKLTIKSTVTCIGRLITRNHLQAYKVEETTEEAKTDCQRLGFICNRVAEEILASSLKPKT